MSVYQPWQTSLSAPCTCAHKVLMVFAAGLREFGPPVVSQGERRGALLRQQAKEQLAHQQESAFVTSTDIYSGAPRLAVF